MKTRGGRLSGRNEPASQFRSHRLPEPPLKLFPRNSIVGLAIATVERCVVLDDSPYRTTGLSVIENSAGYRSLAQVANIVPAQCDLLLPGAWRDQPIARVVSECFPRQPNAWNAL